MNTNTNTFGTTVGRAFGRVAATTVHGAAVACVATGRLGQDIASGASAGFDEHNQRLAALRAKATALRAEALAPVHRFAVEEVKLPARKRVAA